MPETEQQRKERNRQEDLQRLRGFRPMDDDFMRCIFKDDWRIKFMMFHLKMGIALNFCL